MKNEPPPAPRRLKFQRDQRVRSSLDFARIYARKARSSDPVLLIYADTNGLDHTRIGVTVSRKFGNSPRRHRLRRLLKEAFRLQQHQLPVGLDLILIPGQSHAVLTVPQLQASLSNQVPRLARKLAASQASP